MFFLAFVFEEFDETVFFFLPSVSSTRFSIIVFLTHTSKLSIHMKANFERVFFSSSSLNSEYNLFDLFDYQIKMENGKIIKS